MASRLTALCVDATDPQRLADFWAALLGWDRDGSMLAPPDDTGFRLRFEPTDVPKPGPNQIHLDLTSTSTEDQRKRVGRALDLGGRPCDVGQRGDEGHVVLADPEGNELCVIEPANAFLADCPLVGAVNCDGTQAVGYFWSRVLGWPLVWDQDQETAIRSPRGGPMMTWSGPPLMERFGRNRVRLELIASGGADVDAEVARLVDLGATYLGASADGAATLADPDGNEFELRPDAESDEARIVNQG